MSTLGRQTFGNEQAIVKTNIIAVPDGVAYKAGGVTIDWSTVTALAADATLADGTVVRSGDKYLRYGQAVSEILVNAEVQTIDLSPGSDPDAGTWTITMNGETTAAIVYNATAAAVQQAINDLPGVSVGDVTVTKSGFVYTLTYRGGLGNVPAVTTTSSLTISSSPGAITVATGTAGNASGGLFGPVDTTASDGRQTLARGRTYLLMETVVQSDAANSDHPAGAIEGGAVYASRLLVSDITGASTDPTRANLIAVLPSLKLVY